MERIWLIPVIFSILILGSLGFSQQTFAVPISVTFVDSPSCDVLLIPPRLDELGTTIAFPPDERIIAIDDDTEATAPTIVVIPAGQSSASFAIDAVEDGIDDGTQAVTLTVSAPGYSAGSDSFEVTDLLLWHNTASPLDVDGDGFVVALDVLLIINEINEAGTRLLSPPSD